MNFNELLHNYILNNKRFMIGGGLLILLAATIIGISYYFKKNSSSPETNGKDGSKIVMLEEAGKRSESKSDFWWLNSGGIVYLENGTLSTIQGNLDKPSKWRKLYAKNNPRDTENGYQPQNIFRLVTRQKWQNMSQQIYFNIQKINLSKSKYRDASNGVLLFNRYQDGDNLYYTGIRVDGNAVIKKKIDGDYYTMAEEPVYTGAEYDPQSLPSLIPLNKWIGLKSEVINLSGNIVIKLYIDKNSDGKWQMVLEAKDSADKFGKSPLLDSGYGGIRSDFMDVIFRDYSLIELAPE